ncbi:MAG: hypothetical protein JW941_00440 [Candidatus Coatesbacteria bacterium]|nr:hypothetical protein [Candidatus Coatesbacteria bacterium]
MTEEERIEEGENDDVQVEAPSGGVEDNGGTSKPDSGAEKAELLRRAVFAEEALELTRYVRDRALLDKLRGVITGGDETELKQKLSVLKEVLAHIKESQGDNRPTGEGIREIVASEVERNLDRLSNATQTVDAAVGRSPSEERDGRDSATSRLRRLAGMRGIVIK